MAYSKCRHVEDKSKEDTSLLNALLSTSLLTVTTYGHCGTHKTSSANTGCGKHLVQDLM